MGRRAGAPARPATARRMAETVGKYRPFGPWLGRRPRPATGKADAAPPVREYAGADDEALAAWAGAGDRQAFDAVVVRHGTFVLRVAARLLRQVPAAEDAAQEAFLRAWAGIGRFDPGRAKLTTWLYRIVTNVCLDQLRRHQPEPLPGGFDPADPAEGAEALLDADRRATALGQTLAALALVYDEGLSGTQAAAALGVSVKALERLLARGRDCLRKQLDEPAAKGGHP